MGVKSLLIKKCCRKTILKFKYFLVFSGGNSLLIGEMFVDGQNRNVFCNSNKTPINDTKMYFDIGALTNPKFATIPSCYTLSVRNTDKICDSLCPEKRHKMLVTSCAYKWDFTLWIMQLKSEMLLFLVAC